MRHAVFIGNGKVEWQETASPRLQGCAEALVRPIVVGRCDLDVAYVRGQIPLASGSPIGHEIIGEIIDLGHAVKHLRIGQTVFVPAQISCGQCENCKRSLTGRCSSVPFAASYGMGRPGDFGGGLADIVRVPYADAMLTPVPKGVKPITLIGAADMAADAWRAVAPHLSRYPGASVLVLGGGPAVIGLYAAGLAKALGAAAVHYLDNDDRRMEVARAYGAKAITRSGCDEAYDIIVVATALRESLEYAFGKLAPGGNITSVAPTLDGSPQINTAALYHKGATWTIGRPDCRHGHEGTLGAWANCNFCADVVPTTRVAWEDAPEAWASDALYVAAERTPTP